MFFQGFSYIWEFCFLNYLPYLCFYFQLLEAKCCCFCPSANDFPKMLKESLFPAAQCYLLEVGYSSSLNQFYHWINSVPLGLFCTISIAMFKSKQILTINPLPVTLACTSTDFYLILILTLTLILLYFCFRFTLKQDFGEHVMSRHLLSIWKTMTCDTKEESVQFKTSRQMEAWYLM